MLMDFRRDAHLRNAVPEVEHLAIIPEADLPLVGAGAQRKCGKRIGKEYVCRLRATF